MGLFWTNGNFGREAAAFLNWATGGRRLGFVQLAAAFLDLCNWYQ
jgi:hypothetical protein